MKYFISTILLLSYLSFFLYPLDKINGVFTEKQKDNYAYSMIFKDHKNRILKWSWLFDKVKSDTLKNKLGFDSKILRQRVLKKSFSYETQAEKKRKKKLLQEQFKIEEKKYLKKRNRLLAQGLFKTTPLTRKKNQKTDLVDLNFQKAIEYYSIFALPLKILTDQTFTSLFKQKIDPKKRLQFLLSMVQSIPYGIPPINVKERFIGGIFSPPNIFNHGYGDCDSKVLFLSSILSLYPNDYNLVVIYQPDHALLGVELKEKNNYSFLKYKGKKYVYVDSVGPKKLPLGKMAFPQKKIIGIQPINLKSMKTKNLNINHFKPKFQQLGKSYVIDIQDNNKSISDITLNISDANYTGYVQATFNSPYDDGKFYYGSYKKNIFLTSIKKGYFLRKQFINSKQIKKINIDFKDGLQLVKQNPNTQYTLIKYLKKYQNVISYETIPISTDRFGNFKAILDTGKYSIVKGNIRRITKNERIYDYDGESKLVISEFYEL